METKETLVYGCKEDTKKELLYPKGIIVRNYKNPEENKILMGTLGKYFTFYQYNEKEGQKASECDYFFWLYVDDKNEEHWNHIYITCYNNEVVNVHKMYKLKELIEMFEGTGNIEVQYDCILGLIEDIENGK